VIAARRTHLAGLLLSATTEQLFTKSIAAAKALRDSMQLVKAPQR
jgi:hypothetical protein